MQEGTSSQAGFFSRQARRLSHHAPSLRRIGNEMEKRLPKVFSHSEPTTPLLGQNTIAPSNHRENTPLHAFMDTLPSLPTLSAPSLHNFSAPILSLFCSHPEALTDDEDEALSGFDPAPTPKEREKDKSHTENDPKVDPIKQLEGNVVVLGGYRGSILRDAKTNKRVWIPLKVGFGLRKANLGIGLSDEDELKSTETVVPGKMLMALGGVIDLGKRLKDRLKVLEQQSTTTQEKEDPRRPRIKFHNWGYDWRRRLELSSAELLKYLEDLKAESAARGEGPDGTGVGATILAHSMGGLVVLHALATAPDPTVFKSILFAGTPFKGCVNALGPLKLGNNLLFNRDLCSPSVVYSMRSTFYFLPSTGECFETPSGQTLNLDFFDPKTWSDHALSPLTGDLFAPDGPAHRRKRAESKVEAEKAKDGPTVDLVDGAPSMGATARDRTPTHDATELSPLDDGTKGEGDSEIGDYLIRTLKRVKDFYRTIEDSYDPTKAHLYPPLCILTSRKTATVRGVITSSLSTIRDETYAHLLFGEGDGIVLYESARELPGGEDKWMKHLVGVEESTHGHVSLLGDLASVRRCLARLDAERLKKPPS